MNPNKGEAQVNFELPELPPRPRSPEDEKSGEQGREAPAAPAETVGNQAVQPVLSVVPAIPAADQPVIAAPPQDVTAPAPAQAPPRDSDHIEKEWVDKAKAIIAGTSEDPFRQKNEMSKVKAEYIQKRFGKQIKVDEAPAA